MLCANRRTVIDPTSCRSQEAAIWGRAGVVVQPGTHDLFVATSNGPFDGRTDWGDSVLRLSRGAGRLERHYTPANQRVLETTDADLGSAAPALLSRTLLLQGGKDGRLRLLDVRRSLHGVTGAAGPRLGGEVQTLPLRGSGVLVSAIAVRRTRTSTLAFVGTEGATTAYRLRGGRLRLAWTKGFGATSPVLAGGLLWAYDPAGALRVLRADQRPRAAHAAGARRALEQPDRRRRARLPALRRRQRPPHRGDAQRLRPAVRWVGTGA